MFWLIECDSNRKIKGKRNVSLSFGEIKRMVDSLRVISKMEGYFGL